MTAKQFIALRDTCRAKIDYLRNQIDQAQSEVEFPPVQKLRPAQACDIVIDAIIYYFDGDNGPFWRIVEEPLHYGDAFKAYEADDGCRYGLDGAFVEKD